MRKYTHSFSPDTPRSQKRQVITAKWKFNKNARRCRIRLKHIHFYDQPKWRETGSCYCILRKETDKLENLEKTGSKIEFVSDRKKLYFYQFELGRTEEYA